MTPSTSAVADSRASASSRSVVVSFGSLFVQLGSALGKLTLQIDYDHLGIG
jgi:hypothetical protein